MLLVVALTHADEEAAFGVHVVAHRAGRCDVTVTIVDAPASSRLYGKRTTISLIVAAPLRLITPSTLLLAPRSHFRVRTNADDDPHRVLHYALLSVNVTCKCPNASELAEAAAAYPTSSVVHVDQNGLLTAQSEGGTAFLYVAAHNEHHSSLRYDSSVRWSLLTLVVKPLW